MNKTAISDLKLKAKDQLLGNYGIATGSFALFFVITYTLLMIMVMPMSIAAQKTAFSGAAAEAAFAPNELVTFFLSVIIAAFVAVFSVGYLYIIRSIAKGQKPVLSDLFFVFRNHPDKVIIIGIVNMLIRYVFLLPANLTARSGFGSGAMTPAGPDINGRKFLLWIILYFAGFIVSYVISLYLSQSFLIYLDDTDERTVNCLKKSAALMRGNVLRLFYLSISFVGYFFLVLLSFGIASLWVIPYQTMAMVQFYLDIKDGAGEPYAQVEIL